MERRRVIDEALWGVKIFYRGENCSHHIACDAHEIQKAKGKRQNNSLKFKIFKISWILICCFKFFFLHFEFSRASRVARCERLIVLYE